MKKLKKYLTYSAYIGGALVYIYFPLIGWLKSASVITFENPNFKREASIVVYAKEPSKETTETVVSQKEEIVNYIKELFGKDSRVALAVARCESGFNPKAMNDNTTWGGVGRDWGIFQINDVYHANKVLDVSKLSWKGNIELAKIIFDKSGWYAWSAFKNGCYRQYL